MSYANQYAHTSTHGQFTVQQKRGYALIVERLNHNLVLCQYINGDFMSKSKKDGLLPIEDNEPSIKNVDPVCTELREWIKYNPNTGELIRRKSKISTRIGLPITVTKHSDQNGYFYDKIYVNKKNYLVNVAIWCYMTGYKPTRKDVVVFVDGDKKNLKFNNLKLISSSDYFHLLQNNIGEKMGVNKNKVGRPKSRIRAKNRGNRYLGAFDTEQEARIAYLKAKKEIRDSITRKYGITNVSRVVNKKTGGLSV